MNDLGSVRVDPRSLPEKRVDAHPREASSAIDDSSTNQTISTKHISGDSIAEKEDESTHMHPKEAVEIVTYPFSLLHT